MGWWRGCQLLRIGICGGTHSEFITSRREEEQCVERRWVQDGEDGMNLVGGEIVMGMEILKDDFACHEECLDIGIHC